jgi:glycosyltransferase involved in cell wall biosynthesis
MHLFLNALGASAGAGLTYLYNVVPHLCALPDVRTTIAMQAQLRSQLTSCPNTSCVTVPEDLSTPRRFWFEQNELPGIISHSGADVLVSAGNFAVRRSPVPQILLSGNSLYTSAQFLRDLLTRGEYRMWLDTRIKGFFARKSVHWADCTVAPSRSYADELGSWTGAAVAAVHHGFDRDTFFSERTPVPAEIQDKMHSRDKDTVRLLFVSHYNYYRNFETLLRALPLLRERLHGRKLQLFLTCKMKKESNPGSYDPSLAAALIETLRIREEVIELGAVPNDVLNHVYRACDIYVSPAYTETFAHPLVEAMASGLPIVASDLTVHREVCENAAVYFPGFSHSLLAEAVATVALSPTLARSLAVAGQQRSLQFSWNNHVHQLIKLASGLTKSRSLQIQHDYSGAERLCLDHQQVNYIPDAEGGGGCQNRSRQA